MSRRQRLGLVAVLSAAFLVRLLLILTLRGTPYFDTPVGPHDWLTRTVIVGSGKRHANPDYTIFTYYAVL